MYVTALAFRQHQHETRCTAHNPAHLERRNNAHIQQQEEHEDVPALHEHRVRVDQKALRGDLVLDQPDLEKHGERV